MNWKIFSIISLVLIIPLTIIWLIDSKDYGELLIFSRDSKITEVKVYDELLGTETVETQEEDGFWLGLMPADDTLSLKALAAVVPLGGIFIASGFLGMIIHLRKKKK